MSTYCVLGAKTDRHHELSVAAGKDSAEGRVPGLERQW